MARKTAASKKVSDDRLKELLSKEDDKLKKILIFMKSTIQETNLPGFHGKCLKIMLAKYWGIQGVLMLIYERLTSPSLIQWEKKRLKW